MDVTRYFTTRLVDLGLGDPTFRGILTPEPEVNAEKFGVTDQFLADAKTYHAKYSNVAHFTNLFERVFAATGKPPGDNLAILDIGTGSGVNTIEPCLNLLPGCEIVATDISPQLLLILREFLVANGLLDRVMPVATDAMRNHFTPHRFDLVIGASILHHLIDPFEALQTAHRSVRSGGRAIFFEPFEGFGLLRVAFEAILLRAATEAEPLTEKVVTILQAFIRDFEMRAGRDKSNHLFRYMDDKWLFTRTYVTDVAIKAGFKAVNFVQLHDTRQIFHSMAFNLIRMAGGPSTEAEIPAWAWREIDCFDQCLSDDMKNDILFEAGIVLTA